DGIRDLIVTGVQTCALPIFRARHHCALDRGKLLLHRGHHASVRRALLAQLGELAAARRDERGQRLALAAPELDLALALLDVAAQIGRASCRESVWSSVVV